MWTTDPTISPTHDISIPGWRLARLATNAAILLLWLWLYHPLFPYFTVIFAREDFRLNQIVLLGVLALLFLQMRQERLQPRLDAPPQLAWLPLTLLVGGSLLYLIVSHFLDVNTIEATLFALASYGLLGLWLTPQRWRQGLPVALLLIAALPFNEHLQTFVGYPMRLLTARLVSAGLQSVGVASLGLDTILIFENGISHIDLPCSGVKSLWAGAIFLLATTWLQRRPLNLRWLGVALMLTTLLFLVNLLRVAILIIAGQVLGWLLLAELLHVPLGVLGFVLACATTAYLLRSSTGQTADYTDFTDEKSAFISVHQRPLLRPMWLGPALILAILAMILLDTPRVAGGLQQVAAVPWAFPTELTLQSLPLTAQEIDWLTTDGAESAERWRFRWQGVAGTLLLIPSTTWRAHHNPERCLLGEGLTVNQSSAHLVNADFPLRFLLLDDQRQHQQVAATYWFQSAAYTTDDFGSRLWDDLTLTPQRWVLVALLFDQPYQPQEPAVGELYGLLHSVVRDRLAVKE